jgi:cytochrome P450
MERFPVTPGWCGADPADPDYLYDPHPALKRLREEHPVNLTPQGHWRLTRYRDVHRLLHGVPAGMRTSSGRLPGQSDEDAVLNPAAFMLLQDPPAHTRLRKLVSKAFTSWTTDATHGLATSRKMATPEVEQRVAAAEAALANYFSRLFEERRGALGDDLLSVLIAAEEEEGDRLSENELLVQSIGLLIAGFETTIGLIGNGLTELIRHPDEIAKLRERPELIESAVEECLRFAGPIAMTVRVLQDDVEFGGITIPRDAQVFAVLAAANRDPEKFEDPERFDVKRYAREPRPSAHFSFGGGTHHCLGAHLARMESQVAIGNLVQRFDRLALVNERTEWGRSLFRVPARVPVTFRARRG